MALTQGDTVIATVRPSRGEVKRRPAVVVTPTPLIEATVQVVGITTSYRPDDPGVVTLGWRADGRIHTGLRRDSAATVALVMEVAVADVTATGGSLGRWELIAVPDLLKRRGPT